MKTTNDIKLLAALENFELKHKGTRAAPDVCSTWILVRPILVALLPFLGLIPLYGVRIVRAVTALMAGLDAFCPKA